MNQIFEVAGSILVSLGGGSVIVLGLSSWLGKVWANRILENEKKAHQLEIENYKSQLAISLEQIKSLNDKALYISKVQYDKEFQIYQDIWEKLHDCIVETLDLCSKVQSSPVDNDEKEKWIQDKYSKFVVKYNEYSRTIDRYAPFYREDFYQSFVSIRNSCATVGRDFKTYILDAEYGMAYFQQTHKLMPDHEFEEVYNKISQELEVNKNKLKNQIHEYLKSLQVLKI